MVAAASFDEAAHGVLEAICSHLHWEIGAIWLADKQAGSLRCHEIVGGHGREPFVSANRERTFLPGQGFPGRVWSTRQPCWIAELATDGASPRVPTAAAVGLRGGVAVPIQSGNELMGVMEFFFTQPFPPEPPLQHMLESVCRQLGQFLRRERLESELRQAQKLEAVGRLAGGVAHDFNNLLTVIIGFSEMALGSLAPTDPVSELIAEVKKSGERAAALTRQLLAFSRKQVLEPVVLDLNGVISEMQKMLGRLIGEDIELAFCPATKLWRVKADPGQVEQVLMNLVVNARDAMPTGGRLTIETDNVDLDESYAGIHADAQAGKHVLLAVSDTGCGMDSATRERVFEPFFTTKGPHQGTGLGLSTVYGIVRQSGGHVEVYSEPGHGTTFKVYLPRAQDVPQPASSHDYGTDRSRGQETILLVEDEDAVRVMSSNVLEKQGYKVITARDGEEALQHLDRHMGIDLLATDVVMPRLSGRELAERFLDRLPHAKLLYLSGYADDAVIQHGVLEADVPFLQKPYTAETLARKVRDVLDAKPKRNLDWCATAPAGG
jgi:signal transduction histidine kinase/CheY-like chemotaxis protein